MPKIRFCGAELVCRRHRAWRGTEFGYRELQVERLVSRMLYRFLQARKSQMPPKLKKIAGDEEQ
jgi:hypothetical protein